MSTSKRTSTPGKPAARQRVRRARKTTARAALANWRIGALRALAFAAVIGISLLVFGVRNRVREFAVFGYPGVFAIALVSNATVFLPAPGVAIVFAMGSVLNPLGVGLAAGSGGALGELTGYLAGYSGRAVIDPGQPYQQFRAWMQRYGDWAILILAAIPNPMFDVAGIAAGIARMPLWRFMVLCWVGQLAKMTSIALSGLYSISWLARLLE